MLENCFWRFSAMGCAIVAQIHHRPGTRGGKRPKSWMLGSCSVPKRVFPANGSLRLWMRPLVAPVWRGLLHRFWPSLGCEGWRWLRDLERRDAGPHDDHGLTAARAGDWRTRYGCSGCWRFCRQQDLQQGDQSLAVWVQKAEVTRPPKTLYALQRITAISPKASKALRQKVRRDWRLVSRVFMSLSGLASWLNPMIAGWIQYYGRFCRSALHSVLNHINHALEAWAMRKLKRLRGRKHRARAWLRAVARRSPNLFVHWPHQGWMTRAV